MTPTLSTRSFPKLATFVEPLKQAGIYLAFLGAFLYSIAASSSAVALPAEIEMERFLLAAKTHIEAENFETAEVYLTRMQDLKIEIPTDYFYYEGKVKLFNKQYQQALHSLEIYIDKAGRSGNFYIKALAAINQAEEQKDAQQEDDDNTAQNNKKQQAFITAATQKIDKGDNVYMSNLKRLYLTGEPKTALVMHINGLLYSSPYVGSNLIKPQPDRAIFYSLQINNQGDIVTVKQLYTSPGAQNSSAKRPARVISTDRTNVYGRDFFIDHQCRRNSVSCWIRRLDSRTKWLEIGYQPETAAEISKALSHLIKAMQAGSSH